MACDARSPRLHTRRSSEWQPAAGVVQRIQEKAVLTMRRHSPRHAVSHLRSFVSDTKAVAAAEFAIILPLHACAISGKHSSPAMPCRAIQDRTGDAGSCGSCLAVHQHQRQHDERQTRRGSDGRGALLRFGHGGDSIGDNHELRRSGPITSSGSLNSTAPSCRPVGNAADRDANRQHIDDLEQGHLPLTGRHSDMCLPPRSISVRPAISIRGSQIR